MNDLSAIDRIDFSVKRRPAACLPACAEPPAVIHAPDRQYSARAIAIDALRPLHADAKSGACLRAPDADSAIRTSASIRSGADFRVPWRTVPEVRSSGVETTP
jgi:hypothetical protein